MSKESKGRNSGDNLSVSKVKLEWGWSYFSDNGEDPDSDEYLEDSDEGLSASLEDACKSISKSIGVKGLNFYPKQLHWVGGEELSGELMTSNMNYDVMVQGPKGEIAKLIKKGIISKG